MGMEVVAEVSASNCSRGLFFWGVGGVVIGSTCFIERDAVTQNMEIEIMMCVCVRERERNLVIRKNLFSG